ncbi:hypothetical protein M0657_012282 [Pyricularia oryzae]|nr:hypothetical protein M0657_012282 [Pyricularia oryzae]KAI7908505.1 hypothetical protein M9X92_012150 [Pyricularia oryzae]
MGAPLLLWDNFCWPNASLKIFVLIDKYLFYICFSPFISHFGTLATPYQRVDMRRKKLRVVNVRARRPLERKWPPNRQILLESFQLSPVHKIFSMGARTMLLTFARDFRL